MLGEVKRVVGGRGVEQKGCVCPAFENTSRWLDYSMNVYKVIKIPLWCQKLYTIELIYSRTKLNYKVKILSPRAFQYF